MKTHIYPFIDKEHNWLYNNKLVDLSVEQEARIYTTNKSSVPDLPEQIEFEFNYYKGDKYTGIDDEFEIYEVSYNGRSIDVYYLPDWLEERMLEEIEHG